MAGSFGYEKEHYQISKAMAYRKLIPAAESTHRRGGRVIAAGVSCRQQIRSFTNRVALHPAEILAGTQRGVYVAQLGGGQVNTATGDFVFGMTEAYLIEDGRLTAPIRDGNLIGNGPAALLDIDAIAGDFAMGSPGTCGKDGQGVPVGDGTPTLRVARLTVGGTAA